MTNMNKDQNKPNDLLPFKHGEEGTHYACAEVLLDDTMRTCCGCSGHECKENKPREWMHGICSCGCHCGLDKDCPWPTSHAVSCNHCTVMNKTKELEEDYRHDAPSFVWRIYDLVSTDKVFEAEDHSYKVFDNIESQIITKIREKIERKRNKIVYYTPEQLEAQKIYNEAIDEILSAIERMEL